MTEAFWIFAAKVTVVTAMAILVAAAARRARASVRHAIYASLFIALLLLPLAGRFVPKTELPILPSSPSATAPAAVEAAVSPVDSPAATPARDTNRDLPSLTSLAVAIYTAGVGAMLLALLAGVHRLGRWSRRADVWLDGMRVASEIAAESSIRRAVLVVTCREVSVPFTFGFWRQTIVMPAAALSWSDDAVRRALRHELEHVRRDDWAMQLVARIACAVYWPHPFVWIAWRRFCVEAERACDDAVLSDADAAEYATQLVTLARKMSPPRTLPALAMASRSRLSERVTAILDPGRARGPQSRAAVMLIAGVMTAVVMTFGSVHLVAAVSAGMQDAVEEGVSGGIEDGVRDGVREGVSDGVRGAIDEIEDDVDTFGEAIVKAAAKGDIETLDHLFETTSIDINTTISGDGTALLVASRAGQLKTARWLLDRGADPNMPSPGDGNALIAAAGAGQVAVMKLLLDRGARVDEVVLGDENALITAADAGEVEAVKLLISRGADVNARVWSGREWRTALMMAKRDGHVMAERQRHNEIARILTAAGAVE